MEGYLPEYLPSRLTALLAPGLRSSYGLKSTLLALCNRDIFVAKRLHRCLSDPQPLCTYQCIAPRYTYHPTGKPVGDLTYMKSIASPLEQMLGSNPLIRTVYSPLLSILNIDLIPLIQGMFIGQIRSNPHLLPVGWYIGGAIH